MNKIKTPPVQQAAKRRRQALWINATLERALSVEAGLIDSANWHC
jgi:hypothetical protein